MVLSLYSDIIDLSMKEYSQIGHLSVKRVEVNTCNESVNSWRLEYLVVLIILRKGGYGTIY